MTINLRVFMCDACEGEGRIYVREDYYDRLYGWQPGERDTGPCPYCDGTGGEIIATEPVTLEDMEAAYAA